MVREESVVVVAWGEVEEEVEMVGDLVAKGVLIFSPLSTSVASVNFDLFCNLIFF